MTLDITLLLALVMLLLLLFHWPLCKWAQPSTDEDIGQYELGFLQFTCTLLKSHGDHVFDLDGQNFTSRRNNWYPTVCGVFLSVCFDHALSWWLVYWAQLDPKKKYGRDAPQKYGKRQKNWMILPGLDPRTLTVLTSRSSNWATEPFLVEHSLLNIVYNMYPSQSVLRPF